MSDKNETEDLRYAIRRKMQAGEGGCGMTESLRQRLWVLENVPKDASHD